MPKHSLLVSLGLMVFTVALAAKDDGFTGKWVLDKGASTATSDIPDGLTQEIKNKGSDLLIITQWREPQNGLAPLALLGIMTSELRLGLDGQEKTNLIGPFKMVSKSTVNGAQLVTEWTAVVNGDNVTGHWTRTLAPDGKRMTLEIQQQTSDGKSNQGKLEFHRK